MKTEFKTKTEVVTIGAVVHLNQEELERVNSMRANISVSADYSGTTVSLPKDLVKNIHTFLSELLNVEVDDQVNNGQQSNKPTLKQSKHYKILIMLGTTDVINMIVNSLVELKIVHDNEKARAEAIRDLSSSIYDNNGNVTINKFIPVTCVESEKLAEDVCAKLNTIPYVSSMFKRI